MPTGWDRQPDRLSLKIYRSIFISVKFTNIGLACCQRWLSNWECALIKGEWFTQNSYSFFSLSYSMRVVWTFWQDVWWEGRSQEEVVTINTGLENKTSDAPWGPWVCTHCDKGVCLERLLELKLNTDLKEKSYMWYLAKDTRKWSASCNAPVSNSFRSPVPLQEPNQA